MGIFKFIKKEYHSIEDGFNKGVKNLDRQVRHGVNHLKHTSFRDALVMADSRNQELRKAVGIKNTGLEDTTSLEQIEYFSGKLSKGTKNIANIPFVRHIPVVGGIVGEIANASEEVYMLTGELNKAIDEQDEAAKKGQSSIHHYSNIAKTGVKVGKNMNAKYESSIKQDAARMDSRGNTTQHRHHPALTM